MPDHLALSAAGILIIVNVKHNCVYNRNMTGFHVLRRHMTENEQMRIDVLP